MKIMLEVKNTPKKDDILVFNGSKFECINKNTFLMKLQSEIKELKIAIDNCDKTINELAKEIRILKGEE